MKESEHYLLYTYEKVVDYDEEYGRALWVDEKVILGEFETLGSAIREAKAIAQGFIIVWAKQKNGLLLT